MSGWKLIKPKLEECIKHRRKAHREKELKDRKTAREKELAAYFVAFSTTSIELGEDVLLSFADLCQCPQVRKLMEERDWNYEITNDRWQVFKELLPVLIEQHRRRIELDCARLVHHERTRRNDTSSFGNVSSTSEEPEIVSIDANVVYRADVFFHSVQQTWRRLNPSVVSFSDVIQRLQQRVPTSLDYRWNSSEVFYTNDLGDIAVKLLSSLGFEANATMAEMDALGQSFICERCDPLLQKSVSWQELVCVSRLSDAPYSSTDAP